MRVYTLSTSSLDYRDYLAHFLYEAPYKRGQLRPSPRVPLVEAYTFECVYDPPYTIGFEYGLQL